MKIRLIARDYSANAIISAVRIPWRERSGPVSGAPYSEALRSDSKRRLSAADQWQDGLASRISNLNRRENRREFESLSRIPNTPICAALCFQWKLDAFISRVFTRTTP